MKIQINSLTKKFEGKAVFDSFSAELDVDGILLIYGSSGSGKTTLMRMIAGLDSPDSGEIAMPRCKISFMFQEDRLIPFVSVLKNLTAVTDRGTALKYLELMGLTNEQASPPSALSGGMKRRVALARALCRKSELVILDEPFKGLDRRLKIRICEAIKKESADRDFIIITHDREDAELLAAKTAELNTDEAN